jgi:hypothetical protein
LWKMVHPYMVQRQLTPTVKQEKLQTWHKDKKGMKKQISVFYYQKTG